MVGSDWSPVEVQFAHKAPASTAEHARVFGAPVRFGCGINAFVMESDLCDRHVPGADQRLYPIMVRYLDRILEAMPHADGLVVAVRKCIGETMRQGDPTLVQVAERLFVAPRTLQRRLRECGVDFKHLVQDTRRQFSVQYLDDDRNTLTDVAFLLGYSEASAFNRAFKRWTGSTPSSYRWRRHTGAAESVRRRSDRRPATQEAITRARRAG
jgi:AraC-like DNA-binding protein